MKPDDFNFRPCLNPVAGPGRAPTDPHFVVTERFGSTTETPTITFAHPAPTHHHDHPGAGRQLVRLPGAAGRGRSRCASKYTDWQGRNNMVWLERTADGYQFHGATRPDGTLEADPDDCATCWSRASCSTSGPTASSARPGSRCPSRPPASRRTRRRGRQFIPAVTGHPPSTPTTSGPAGRSAPVTYTWRFQRQLRRLPVHPSGGPFFEVMPDYGDPVPGAVVSHAWPPVRQLPRPGGGDRQRGPHRPRTSSSSGSTRWRPLSPWPATAHCRPSRSPATTTRRRPATESILFGGVSRFDHPRPARGPGRLGRRHRLLPAGRRRAASSCKRARSPSSRSRRRADLDYLLSATHTYAKPGYLHGHGRGQEPDRRRADPSRRC